MIWKPTGKRHLNGEAPLSMYDRPLQIGISDGLPDLYQDCLHSQLEPIGHDDAKDVERELDGYELAP